MTVPNYSDAIQVAPREKQQKRLTICVSKMVYTLRTNAFLISGELSDTLTPYCGIHINKPVDRPM